MELYSSYPGTVLGVVVSRSFSTYGVEQVSASYSASGKHESLVYDDYLIGSCCGVLLRMVGFLSDFC